MKKMVLGIGIATVLLLSFSSYLLFSTINNQDTNLTNINQENLIKGMTPQIIKLAPGEQKIVGDLTIKNTGDGYKRVMPEGDTSYAKLEVETRRKPKEELIIGVFNSLGNPIKYEVVEFDYYLITVTDQQFSGDLELSISLKPETVAVPASEGQDLPLVIELAKGEAKTIGDLTIMNLGGGHKKVEEGDLSFTRLVMETPSRALEAFTVFTHVGEPTLPDGMTFTTYNVFVEEVGWNGQTVKLRLSKNQNEVLPPITPANNSDVFPMTFELKMNETKVVGDLTITNQGGGHKILMEGGDLSFAELSLATPKRTLETLRVFEQEGEPNQDKGLTFENYSIFTEEVDWNGDRVKLTVFDNNLPDLKGGEPIPIDSLAPVTLELKKSETKTIGDLTIANLGGGHEITIEGSDVTFSNLSFKTPRKPLEKIMVFGPADESSQPDKRVFDNYQIVTEEVSWNGDTVKLRISKNNSGVASPTTTLAEPQVINIESPVTVEIAKGNTTTVGGLTITNQGNTITAAGSDELARATTLLLESPTQPQTMYGVTQPVLGEQRIGYKYAGYLIHTEAVGPEGDTVRLRIETDESSSNNLLLETDKPIVLHLGEGEAKTVGDLTIFNELSGDAVMNTGSSRLFNHIVLSSSKLPEQKFKLTTPFFGASGEVEQQIVSFGDYQIKVISQVWGGELELQIKLGN